MRVAKVIEDHPSKFGLKQFNGCQERLCGQTDRHQPIMHFLFHIRKYATTHKNESLKIYSVILSGHA